MNAGRKWSLAVAVGIGASIPQFAVSQVVVHATGRISGVAWDSLARRPLAHAAIWTSNGQRATMADSVGRFTLDSLAPGEHELVVVDSTLDAVGLDLTRRVQVPAAGGDTPRQVVLATPSMGTLRARLCERDAGRSRAGDRSPAGGILFGLVIEPTGGRRVAGAVIEVSWARVEMLAGQPVPLTATAHVTSDSMGEFAACEVPADTLLTVTALGGSLGRAAARTVALGAQRLGRLDLTLAPSGEPRRDSIPR